MTIDSFRIAFEPHFAREVSRLVTEANGYTSDPHVAEVVGYSGELLLAPGKRLRPYLVRLGSLISDGNTLSFEDIVPVAVGMELFHVFALIHDDVCDDDKVRRGLQTANARFDNNQAILVGDLVYSWANRYLAVGPILREVSSMANEVITGQMLDVFYAKDHDWAPHLMDEIIAKKSAGYSIHRPLRLGMALAGVVNPEIEDLVARFSRHAGYAFQIADDREDLDADRRAARPNALLVYGEKEAIERASHSVAEARELAAKIPFQDGGREGALHLLACMEAKLGR